MNRIKNEASFHDRILLEFNEKDTVIQPYFEVITAVENQYILKEMGDLRGRRILDFGCGVGEAGIYFAMQGALVTGVDVSPMAISFAKRLAAQYKVEAEWLVSESESLENFSNSSFDFIYGNGVLHHINLDRYLPEFERVLRPGGRSFFIEPLKYNPVINIYRSIAKEVRSPDEKPLGLSEVKRAQKYFPHVKSRGFWLTSLYLFCHFFLFERSNPNKERYWRKVILDGDKYRRLVTPLFAIDRFLLKLLPPLKYLCWNLVLVFQKKS